MNCQCECHDPGVYGAGEARPQDDPCGRCAPAHAPQDAETSNDGAMTRQAPTAPSEDRLAQVQPRSTYVVHLWKDGHIGHVTIGPFTRVETDRLVTTLTCNYRVERIDSNVPDWARTAPTKRYGEVEVTEAIRRARRTDAEVERDADAAIADWLND